MTATAVPLADRLAAWIVSEGIATGDLAVQVAASLLEDKTMTGLAGLTGTGDPRLRVLRDAAIALAVIIGAGPEEWAAEEWHHGHGRKPPRRRKRAPMTSEGEAA